MVPPDPLNVISSRFWVEATHEGYTLHYQIRRGRPEDGIMPSDHWIKLIDRRADKSTPMPASWSFKPSYALPEFDDIYGSKADQERASRYFKTWGNVLGRAFAEKEPFDIPAPRRDFDTICIYAGPGVTVEPDRDIRSTMPGGDREAEFSMGMIPTFLPFVEVYRIQTPDRIPQIGESVSSRDLLASHVRSNRLDDQDMSETFDKLAPFLMEFDETVSGMTLAQFYAATEVHRSWVEHLFGPIDTKTSMAVLKRDMPGIYAELYLAAYFIITNTLLYGDELKFTPMPWGLRISHLKSLININVRVPVTSQDPYFRRERLEATLGRPVVDAGSNGDAFAKFSVFLRQDVLDRMAQDMEWVAIDAAMGFGELTPEEESEVQASDEAEAVSAISGSVHWLVAVPDEAFADPPIIIFKTPSVNVTLDAAGIAEITANAVGYRTGTRDASHSKEIDHIKSVPLVECWEFPIADAVPDEGTPLTLPSPDRATRLKIEGQRDRAQLLTDELKADLIDGGLRLIPIYGDALDLVELAIGLYSGRDLYGRKVTSFDLALMSLAILPIVNNGIIKAGAKVPKSLARVLRGAELGATGTGVVILSTGLYDIWDVITLSGSPQNTAEFF